jgi:hypothetical protein
MLMAMRNLGIAVVSCFIVSCGGVVATQDAAPTKMDAPELCTGTCECRVDSDCIGAHKACDDQGTSRTCRCVAGYTLGASSNACEWTGVIEDPGFANASKWQLGRTITIDASAGLIDPGFAHYDDPAMCGLDRISQQITMPRRALAEPLVVEITHRTSVPNFRIRSVGPAFGIGTTWQSPPPSFGSFTTTRICLGSGYFAAPTSKGVGEVTKFEIMPNDLAQACPAGASGLLDIDHLEIKPANANECAAPASVLNGNAENSEGWVFVATGTNGTAASSSILPNVGEGNSKGVRLSFSNRCSSAFATTAVSVPTAAEMPSPAISFFTQGFPSGVTAISMVASMGGVTFLNDGPNQLPATQRLCIPAFMRGTAQLFSAQLSSFGGCAEIINASATYDSIALVNDPSCGTSDSVANGGFESPLKLPDVSPPVAGAKVTTSSDPGKAHSGSAALQLSVSLSCATPTHKVNFVVPSSAGSAGPALKFFYKGSAGSASFRAVLGRVQFAPVINGSYQQGIMCLNPRLAGRIQAIQFSMTSTGACGVGFAEEFSFVDDIETTTDASCPAM